MIYRKRTKQQYTNISSGIFRNQELSLRDRGLLTTLLSLPDNWKFSVSGLAEILKKDGKHTINAGLASLEEKGYLVRRQLKSEDGKFKGYEWDIFEEPQVKVPIADFQKTKKRFIEISGSMDWWKSRLRKRLQKWFLRN